MSSPQGPRPEPGAWVADADRPTEVVVESVDGPVADESTTDNPVVDNLVADDPVTGDPVVDDPVSDVPVRDDSAPKDRDLDTPVANDSARDEQASAAADDSDGLRMGAAIADDPTRGYPAADDPLADHPVADDPLADDPVRDDPVRDDLAADESLADDLVADDLVTDDLVADDPVVDDLAADDPCPDELSGEPDSAGPSEVPDVAATAVAPSQDATEDAAEDTTEDSVEEELPELDDYELEKALEALLLVVDTPVEEDVLASAVRTSVDRVAETLDRMAGHLSEHERGFDLRRAGGGWRYYTRDKYAPYVEKMLLDGQRAKLTRAALETLAVIAYRQPVTRARVAAVRGVNCDGVIRTLLARGLVEETGTDVDTGGYLYRTTELFLERLGLASLEDLPPIAPLLPEVDSIDDV